MKLRRLLKRPDFMKAPPGAHGYANENVSPYGLQLDLRPEPPSLEARLLVWAGQLTVLLLVASLSFWAGTRFHSQPLPAVQVQPHTTATFHRTPRNPHVPLSREARSAARKAATAARHAREAAAGPGPRYVHRGGSDLRDEAKTSGHVLKKEAKGVKVMLLSQTDDGWAKVTDGNITGWMRASVLELDPPASP
jgi:hypothetical protein